MAHESSSRDSLLKQLAVVQDKNEQLKAELNTVQEALKTKGRKSDNEIEALHADLERNKKDTEKKIEK